jgi:DNA-binding XRE family transcriptional regulator
MSQKMKLIRTEQGLSQEQMAAVLSISKKTLVAIEKGRAYVSFGNAVAVAVIFEDSDIVGMILGGDVQDSIKSLALNAYEHLPQTMNGKVWWRDIEISGGYKIQQNIVSQHYRILTIEDRRVCSSFDAKYIKNRFAELTVQKTIAAKKEGCS